jgi:protein-tyrosine-phosphatase
MLGQAPSEIGKAGIMLSMKIHFICRGNVLRSLIAETYLQSLKLPNVTVSSSGTNVDLTNPTEREYFANTIALFKRHNLERYAKDTSHQLTQERANDQDITICMNQRVVDEAASLVTLPEGTINWDIVDIGEGHRTVPEDIRIYEEEIFREIAIRVDELVKKLSLDKL